MGSIKRIKRKFSLRKFHRKVDELEEKIVAKVKEGWAFMVQTISAKLKKDPSEEVEEEQEREKETTKLVQRKVKKKVRTIPAIKRVISSKSNKPPLKPVNLDKKSEVKTEPKLSNKLEANPVLKSKKAVTEKSLVKNSDEIKGFKSSSLNNSSSDASKKRGRPKKNEKFVAAKTKHLSPSLSKKSKNLKKTKVK